MNVYINEHGCRRSLARRASRHAPRKDTAHLQGSTAKGHSHQLPATRSHNVECLLQVNPAPPPSTRQYTPQNCKQQNSKLVARERTFLGNRT